MRTSIPESPSLWRQDYLKSTDCRKVIAERIHTAEMLYQAGVAKRSSDLARSTHVSTAIGGTTTKYWEGTLTVGETGLAADYVLAHEFGADERFDANRGDPSFDETEGAHDLNAVLQSMIWVPL